MKWSNLGIGVVEGGAGEGGTSGQAKRWETKRRKGEDECDGGDGHEMIQLRGWSGGRQRRTSGQVKRRGKRRDGVVEGGVGEGGTSGQAKRWETKRWKGEDECSGGNGHEMIQPRGWSGGRRRRTSGQVKRRGRRRDGRVKTSAAEDIGNENGGTSGQAKRWEMKRRKGEDDCGGGRRRRK